MKDRALARRVRSWHDRPYRFAEDAMRWDGDTGGVAPLKLEDYQKDFMAMASRYRGVNKSRQVGFSFIFAVESLTRAVLDPGHTSMFVSYNMDDAREKITIIHKLIDLSPAVQRLCEFDTLKDQVRLRRKDQKQWSLIRSLPCRPVRGKTKADLYLDELAHYQDAEDVYLGSVPATVRASGGAGQITVASTPNGRIGVFWECVAGSRSAPYMRMEVPWWYSRYLCKDVPMAIQCAPQMTTIERVEHFGLPNIRELFDGMALIDFQQEFEAAFIDSAASYFPMDLIEENVLKGSTLCKDMSEVLKRKKGELYVGVDIGRHKDNTEIVVIDRWKCDQASTGYAYTPRLILTFDRVDTQRQGDEMERLLDMTEIVRDDAGNVLYGPDGKPRERTVVEQLWIDATGIGLPLYERLKEHDFDRVTGLTFSAPVKEKLAVLTRRVMERKLLDLPDKTAGDDAYKQRAARELCEQIHSIKRTPLAGRHARYESESSTHHGDQFWALALALQCAREDLRPTRATDQVRIIG